MRKSPSALARPEPYAPWLRPVAPTTSPWPFPATAWCAATAISPATAGAWSASANCSSEKPAAKKRRRPASHGLWQEIRGILWHAPISISIKPHDGHRCAQRHPTSALPIKKPAVQLRAFFSVRTQCLLIGRQRSLGLVGRHSGLDQFLANFVFKLLPHRLHRFTPFVTLLGGQFDDLAGAGLDDVRAGGT